MPTPLPPYWGSTLAARYIEHISLSAFLSLTGCIRWKVSEDEPLFRTLGPMFLGCRQEEILYFMQTSYSTSHSSKNCSWATAPLPWVDKRRHESSVGIRNIQGEDSTNSGYYFLSESLINLPPLTMEPLSLMLHRPRCCAVLDAAQIIKNVD